MTRSPEHAAQQVDQILDAALRSIARRGYAASSLARIAEEARTSKRMLLYWFESKDALIAGLAERLVERIVAVALQSADPDADPGVRAAESLRAVWEHLRAEPDLVAAYVAVLGESRATPELAVTLDQVRRAHEAVFDAYVAEALDAGSEPPLDREALSVWAFGGLRGLVLELFERGPSPASDGAFELFAAQVAAALRP